MKCCAPLAIWIVLVLSFGLRAEDMALSAGGVESPVASPAGIDQAAFNQLTFLPPELVEQMDSRRLAEMIVARLHHFCDKDRDPDAKPFPEGEDDILMLVPAQHLASIARFGFKNQHQTSSTGGCDCKVSRLRAEMQHVGMGLPYTHKTRELLPKYALKTFSHDRHGTFNVPYEYGNVIIKFKPEVRRRTTWSKFDSLGLPNPLRTHFKGPKKSLRCDGYCEAQIWGELDFSDVESIRIPEDLPVSDHMKNLGVPIFTYVRPKAATLPAWGVPPGYDPYAGYAPYPGYASYPGGAPYAPGPAPVGYSPPPEPLPSMGSLRKISFKSDPIYLPVTAKPPAVAKLSLDAAERERASGSKAQRLILESQILSQLSTEELIKRYRTTAETFDSISEPAIRVMAELTGRPKTPELLKFLTNTAKSDPAPMARDMALAGLLSLPWDQLKPMLLDRLRDDGTPAYAKYSQAFDFILAKHTSDPDVKRYFEKKQMYEALLSHATRKAGRPVCNESMD